MTTKEQLIRSAELLRPPPAAAAQAYELKRTVLTAEVNDLIFARQDADRLIGEGNRGLVTSNHANHAQFMASVFQLYSPLLLVETVLWVYQTYRSHGVAPGYWPVQLGLWRTAMRKHLAEQEIEPLDAFYRWLMEHHEDFLTLSETLDPLEAPFAAGSPEEGHLS